jgi:glycosyltransferase involved in cell wall biosynthesis
MRSGLLDAHSYLRPERIAVVFNGKHAAGPSAPGTRHDPVRFVAAYRLAPDKLHMDLLHAFRNLLDSGRTRFTCEIYGDGPMAPVLEAAVRSLGLDGHVRLMGFASNVSEVLDEYDFGVLTSRIEGLSNTVLEYMAAGLPVVTTNRGALPEMVTHRGNGLCYDPGDVSALTGHLAACLDMPDSEYARMSAEALATIRLRFQREQLAGQLEHYLQQLADQGMRVRGRPGTHPV